MFQRNRARRAWLAALMAACVGLGLSVLPGPQAEARPARHAQKLRVEPLEVVTNQGVSHFKVEIADTDSSRETGLMYRKSIAPDRGMLFDFKTPRPVSFWMKNCLMPIDMIFIGANGRVVSIARNAVPGDETPIPSGGDVLGVLELGGGRAAQIGVLPGDRIRHRIFPRG